MKKVLLGMSGGVDSSASLLLLKNQGYDVEGITLYLTNVNEESIKNAKEVCDALNIKHHTLDLKENFKNCVIKNFIDEYEINRTPNPCIQCNKYIKFGKMYDYALENGFDFIATGHYAKIEYSEEYKRYVLKKADNIKKDQSYVLYNLKLDQLPHILFPLNNIESKDKARKLLSEHNLKVSKEKESQDICFIPDGDYKEFLKGKLLQIPKKGNIIYNKLILGQHDGLYKYTIGQRKGLGVSFNEPLYVIGFKDNDLMVGKKEDLKIDEFRVKNYNLLLVDEIKEPIKVDVKTRYKQKLARATITMEEEYIKVVFDEPQSGVTPGQSAVFYIDDIVLGGGIIV